jgi:isocitrate lyase
VTRQQAIAEIEREWGSDRWAGVERPYTGEDVYKIRGSVRIEHSLARAAERRSFGS